MEKTIYGTTGISGSSVTLCMEYIVDGGGGMDSNGGGPPANGGGTGGGEKRVKKYSIKSGTV